MDPGVYTVMVAAPGFQATQVKNTGTGAQRPNRIASGKLDHPTVVTSTISAPRNVQFGLKFNP